MARGLALPWTVLYRPDTPATVDDTREALAAMVREGEAAGMYAGDHGSAGFCTDHAKPAVRPSPDALLGALPGLRYENDGHDRPATVADAVEVGARAVWVAVHPDLADKHLATCMPLHEQDARVVLEAVRYADLLAEVERLQGSADAWWTEYDKALTESGRLLRIIDGYDRTPAEQRAAAAEAERDVLVATVARVEAECERWLTSLGRPAPDRLDVWTNGARAFAEHLAALVTDTPTEGGAR